MLDGEIAAPEPLYEIKAEKALLGSLFVNNRVYEKVSDFLKSEHFAYGPHGDIFDASVQLMEQGKPADPITLRRFFEQHGDLSSLGGAAYLSDLANNAVGAVNAGEYGRIVYDTFQKRELATIGQSLFARVHECGHAKTADDIREEFEAELTRLTDGVARDTMASLSTIAGPALKAIEDAAKRGGGLAGISTGLIDLDSQMGGMAAGGLFIVAGATAMGKTALALNIAEHVAQAHGPVAFFSLEMSKGELFNRLLSRRTGIGIQELRRGTDLDDKWPAMNAAAKEIGALPLVVDDGGGLTVSQVRSRARRIKRQRGLSLVVVDYLQILQADSRYKGQRVNEVGEISRTLKALAMELKVPVLALSQLSRAVDARDNNGHRPIKSDLRESGSLEQDADAILLLYREGYYISQRQPGRRDGETDQDFFRRQSNWEIQLAQAQGKAEVIIAKNRHGPDGTVDVHFDAERNVFGNLARGA